MPDPQPSGPIEQLRYRLRRRPNDPVLWAELAGACGVAGLSSLARSAGRQALAIELQQVNAGSPPGESAPLSPLPKGVVPPGVGHAVVSLVMRSPAERPRAHVLATALRLPELLPGWRLRIHAETPLPSAWLEQLAALGAELRLSAAHLPPQLRPLAHLQVIADPGAVHWLLLDDAHPLTPELAEAVRAWQASETDLQLHRWCWDQAQLVPLAGLAGRAGVLPDLLGWLQSQPPLREQPLAEIERQLGLLLWRRSRTPLPQWDRCFGDDAPPAALACPDPLAATWLQPWLVRYGLSGARANPAAGTEPNLLAARLPWPQVAAPTAEPARPRRGAFINLAAQTQRRQRMEAQLASLPWAAGYRRFEAHKATADEASALGLASAGELGIWRSLLALLREWLASAPPDTALLHVLEDDAVLHPDLAAAADAAFTALPQLDLLFGDAFLTPDLYLALLDEWQRLQQASPRRFGLVGGEHYRSCLSCWLVSGAGARRLLADLEALLSELPAAGRPLPPLDTAIRGLIRAGRLRAAITLPFLATITSDNDSAIQQGGASLLRSQRLDLQLRRLLYAGDAQLTPEAVLQETQQLLATTLSASEQLELMGVALRHGRSRGWLPEY